MMTRALAVVVATLLGGCAMRPPVVADVRCPKDAHPVESPSGGQCVLRDGSRHGPSWTVSPAGVAIDGYDHGALAGPYERYDARGERTEQGYRPGVTSSTQPSTETGEAKYDSPRTTGRLVVPERVRLFPVQGDVAFEAATLLSSSGQRTSSFLGATIDIALPAPERIRHRGDAYRAFYLAYGVQGAAGAVARAECDDPTIAGSGGFCGSRVLVGPYIRVGYARTPFGDARGALPTLLGYGRLGFLLGQDDWSSTYSSGSALVWRLRAGGGFTALGAVLSLLDRAKHASPVEGVWRALLVPLAVIAEHAEAWVELGADGGQTTGLGVGGGIDIGFGL